MKTRQLAAIIAVTATLCTVPSAFAQQEAPQVSVVNLQVVRNADGTQSVITPKGDLAPLPGAGVAGNVAQIYVGSRGGFWYTDARGETVDLAPAVQALEQRRAAAAARQPVPQYAPMPEYQQAAPQQNYSNGSSALATGAAAAAGASLGAMAGAAMSAPYGTPYYYGAGGNPYYYGAAGNLTPNQQAALYNAHTINQQQQAQAIAGRQATQQSAIAQTGVNQSQRQNSMSQNQAQRQSAYGGSSESASNFQKQQEWYQNQLKQNPNRFQQTGQNPFARSEQGQGAAASERASRESGGRFGGRFGGGESGGRFGGRFGGGDAGGAAAGRLGGGDGNGGGRFAGARRGRRR